MYAHICPNLSNQCFRQSWIIDRTELLMIKFMKLTKI